METQTQIGIRLWTLLLVVGIISVLGALSVYSLNTSRVHTRDAKRLSDIRQIQVGLELYYNDHKAYPAPPKADGGIIGVADSICLGENGFGIECVGKIYMGRLPKDPRNKGRYQYRYIQKSEQSEYGVSFALEDELSDLPGDRALCLSSRESTKIRISNTCP